MECPRCKSTGITEAYFRSAVETQTVWCMRCGALIDTRTWTVFDESVPFSERTMNTYTENRKKCEEYRKR